MRSVSLLVGLLASGLEAGPVQGPHSSVELVAERRWVQPGQPLQLGLVFRMEPGWHVYWKNPGDSGSAPVVEWKLPAGFEAEALQWPAPKLILAPPLASFGYEDEVLLPARVKTPGDIRGGSSVRLRARVEWVGPARRSACRAPARPS